MSKYSLLGFATLVTTVCMCSGGSPIDCNFDQGLCQGYTVTPNDNSFQWKTESRSFGKYDRELAIFTPNDYSFDHGYVTVQNSVWMPFRVQACNDAHLELSSVPGFLLNQTYEIVLGSGRNTKSDIRVGRQGRGGGGVRVNTPDIMKCAVMQQFWVSWESGLIQVGRGAIYGQQTFMSWYDPNAFPVYGISVATGWGATAEWRLPLMPDHQTVISTPNDYEFNHGWIRVDDRQDFLFSVQACNDAHLALSAEPGKEDSDTYEIVLSGYSGTRSDIRDAKQGTVRASANTRNFLSCNETRPFWVSWRNAYIEVGRGYIIGQNRFMTWLDPVPHPVNAISFATGWGSSAKWSIYEEQGRPVTIYTPNDYNFVHGWITTYGLNQIVFEIEACSDAHIQLPLDPTNTAVDVYEVVLGGWANTQSAIRDRKMGELKTQAATPNILNCDEFRKFWISWKGGLIQVGTGSLYGINRIMSWQDPAPHLVNAVSVATGFGHEAIWRLPVFPGRETHIMTPNDYIYNHAWTPVHDLQYKVFRVKGCNDVHVALMATPGRDESAMYEIVIGGWGNTQSVIRNKKQGRNLFTAKTKNFLNCEDFRSFWVGWKDNKIEVGRGLVYGQQRFMIWARLNTYQFKALSVSTGWGSTGEWVFFEQSGRLNYMKPRNDHTAAGGREMAIYTPNDYNFKHGWFSVQNTNHIVLKIQACNDAHIALMTTPGVDSADTYEIVIGGWRNTKTVLRPSKGGKPMATALTRDILSCDELRSFWISWYDKSIEIGSGNVYGMNRIIYYPDPNFHDVNAISYATGWGSSAEWRLTVSEGMSAAILTPNDYSNKHGWVKVHDVTSINIQVKACNDAHIYLMATAGIDTELTYEIVLSGWGGTKSVIRDAKQGNIMAEADTTGYLDCDSLRNFWVSWTDGWIKVGKGFDGQNEFLGWQHINPRVISAVAFASGYGAAAEWRFVEPQGRVTSIKTINDYYFKHGWVSTQETTFMPFQIQACNDGHIQLQGIIGDITQQTYEIVLGGNRNRNSMIRAKSRGPDMIRVKTDQFLNCTEMRPFWVSWANGNIEVGRGFVYGMDRFMAWQDPSPHPVNALSFATGWGSTAEWRIPTAPGHSTQIMTPNDYKFEHGWMDVRDRVGQTFRVQACNDAHLALTEVKQDGTGRIYELVLGSYANQKTNIRDCKSCGDKAIVDTPDIMQCNQTLDFWVRWDSGLIEMGRGNVFGVDRIIFWQDPNPHRVDIVSVSTGWGSTAIWAFDEPAGQYAYADVNYGTSSDTSNLVSPTLPPNSLDCLEAYYHIQDPNSGSLNVRFSEAGGQVIIDEKRLPASATDGWNHALVPVNSNGQSFQIIFAAMHGYGSKGYISVDDVRLLAGQCSFYDTNKTTMPVNILPTPQPDPTTTTRAPVVTLPPPVPPASPTAGDCNFEEGTCGYTVNPWESNKYHFEKEDGGALFAGKKMAIYTPNDYDFKHGWVTVTGYDYIEFTVKACNDAHILLSNIPGEIDELVIQVIIGGWKNTKSAIRTGRTVGTPIVKQTNTPNILDCNEARSFWLSWKNGRIRVGQHGLYQDQFLQWSQPRNNPINSISVATGWGSWGDWRLPVLMGQSSTLFTPNDYAFSHGYLEVDDKTWMIFDVQACSDAHLALAATSDDFSKNTYEIVIGGWSGTKSVIRDARGGGVMAEAETLDIVTCEEFRSFWVSWKNGLIEVGKGKTHGVGRFMFWTDPNAHVVKALSLATGWGSRGKWTLYHPIGREVRIQTPNDYRFDHGYVTVGSSTSLLFNVKTCNDAHLELLERPNLIDCNVYEIVIGCCGGRGTSIRNRRLGPNKQSAWTPNVLACNETRPFWVSWDGGVIAVGEGSLVGVNGIIAWKDPDPHGVKAVAFASWSTASAEWSVQLLPGQTSVVNTPNDYTFNHGWVGVQDRTSAVFDVQACNDAHLALSTEPGNGDVNTYEIVIGGWDGTKSAIRESKQGQTVVFVDTPDILNCNVSRTFWVSWLNGAINVGRGPVVGMNSFMSWTDSDPYVVNVISVATGWGSSAIWKFQQDLPALVDVVRPIQDHTSLSSHEVQINTPNDYNFKHGWVATGDTKFFTFAVQACSDAHLELQATPGDTDNLNYEIVIGGWSNTQSVIRTRKMGPNVAVFQTPNLLSCSAFHLFWLSWAGGVIEVGTGSSYGAGRFLGWQDPNPHAVTAISMTTGYGSNGVWRFLHSSDKSVLINTPNDYEFVHGYMNVHDRVGVQFEIQACNDAHIALESKPSVVGVPQAYEIVLGGWSNTRSVIRDGKQGTEKVTVDTPNLLNCTVFLPFWVTWQNGIIRVGKGFSYGRNLLMEWQDTTPKPVTVISVATGWGSTANWNFREPTGREVRIMTPNDYNFNHGMLKQTGTHMIFKVMACNDAHIELQEDTIRNRENVYEIVLSGYGGSRSDIRTGRGGPAMSYAPTSGFLSCTEFKSFWIGWENGFIQVGQGTVFGANRFMAWQDPTPHQVNIITFATGWGATGVWSVSLPPAGLVDILTPNDYKFEHGWLMVSDRTWMPVQIKACNDAHFALSAQPGDGTVETYEIVLGGYSNQKSDIRAVKQGPPMNQAETPDLMKCDLTLTFWVSWKGGLIEVGHGGVYGKNRFLNWQDPNPHPVNAFSVATGWGSTGMFRFKESPGSYMIADSVVGTTRDTAILTSPPISPMSLACAEVYIMLSGTDIGEFKMGYGYPGDSTPQWQIMTGPFQTGGQWIPIRMAIDQRREFQLMFLAAEGLGYSATIAIDDIKIYNELCFTYVNPMPTPGTLSTPAFTGTTTKFTLPVQTTTKGRFTLPPLVTTRRPIFTFPPRTTSKFTIPPRTTSRFTFPPWTWKPVTTRPWSPVSTPGRISGTQTPKTSVNAAAIVIPILIVLIIAAIAIFIFSKKRKGEDWKESIKKIYNRNPSHQRFDNPNSVNYSQGGGVGGLDNPTYGTGSSSVSGLPSTKSEA
ncbi:unnamed protein product [Owenia fusiformis]|uniref:MAM domain-containing protein n=1 Tax=Owenia fusiformis TaxID=6347 RepID=A0A8S4PNU3_OWEFU|nr:unnamed protein product [Owenia fusiformis]